MKILFFSAFWLLFFVPQLKAQYPETFTDKQYESGKQNGQKAKTKSAKYNSLGYNFNTGPKDIVVGGTSVSYRRFGSFVNYKVGIQNFMMPTQGERGTYTYNNVKENNWTMTGNTEQSVSFMVGIGLTVAITRRIPLYVGPSIIRTRQFFEYLDPNDGNKAKWNVNETKTEFKPSFTAGVFVPLFNRVVLNLGYDHDPQFIFVGLCISGIYNFEDADEWWWGANKE